MKKVATVKMIREAEEAIIRSKLSEKELMDRAALAVMESVSFHGKIAIVCGPGNNGGDGYALALHLWAKNTEVELFLVENKFSVTGKYYFEQCKSCGIPFTFWNEKTSFSNFDMIVDAIYGTGFHGTIRKPIDLLIQKINNSNSTVISIDINSGINADNGLTTQAIKATKIIAIECFKPGHFLNMAKDYRNEVTAKSIGIPLNYNTYQLLEIEDIAPLFTERKNFSNKGDYGKSLLIGGSSQYIGALQLASMSLSSLKVGSGISILGIPKSIYPIIASRTLESVLYPLEDSDGYMIYEESTIKKMIEGVTAIGIGPGWGKNDQDYQKILTFLIKNSSVPLIIDADGLNTLSRMDVAILKKASGKVILTPHPKEFARLVKRTVQEILEDPITLAKNFAREYQVIVLLKGPTTIITDGEEVYLVDKGTPGMATAGSGDVLTGILTGLCSYLEPNLLTISSGAYINGLAGELANQEINTYSIVASDTITYLPKALNKIIKIRKDEF